MGGFMLELSLLHKHPSSPTRIIGNLQALAERKDLYTGDDFYFGFDSSNHSFLDIIGNHQLLAIKHGPLLSFYREGKNDFHYAAYYIDVKNKTLVSLVDITAKADASLLFQQLLPWSFTDFYSQVTKSSSAAQSSNKVIEETKPKNTLLYSTMIKEMIEKIATSYWPEESVLTTLPTAVKHLNTQMKDLTINLSDISSLKKEFNIINIKSNSDDFVAPYNPFYDNARISTDFLMLVNPQQITVRIINDKDPRIEIISPEELADGKKYRAIYKHTSSDMYDSFRDSIDNMSAIKALLKDQVFRDNIKLTKP
jgi:hypothetical protein